MEESLKELAEMVGVKPNIAHVVGELTQIGMLLSGKARVMWPLATPAQEEARRAYIYGGMCSLDEVLGWDMLNINQEEEERFYWLFASTLAA
jgi:hypothetical protein